MKPEQYWIDRGEDVIGTDVLHDGDKARQAATYQAIADWLIGHQAQDVLDVGCNVAALYSFLIRLGYQGRYFGVDTNPFAIMLARKVYKVNVSECSIRQLTWPGQTFQAVVVKDVIEHLEGPHLLAEAFRVAREYVIVATYIPWHHHEARIERHPDGYYTNRYCVGDVSVLADVWGFDPIDVMGPVETNGTRNAIYIFHRKQVTT